MLPLESVPNVSEGRDPSVVAAIADAFSSAGARVLDTHLDGDHHRAVVTLVGDDHALEQGLVVGDRARRAAGSTCAPTTASTRAWEPRTWCRVVPLGAGDLSRCVAVAHEVGRRVGEEVGLPVFLYGVVGEGRRPAFFRRGGPEELQRRIDAGELAPAYGPRQIDARAGAVLVGVRRPLLAYNIELLGTLETAREVAQAVRESSGGLPGVQALGLRLSSGAVQISTNVIDLDATAPHVMVERIATEAAARGAGVGRGELVGLVPAASVARAARAAGVQSPLGSTVVFPAPLRSRRRRTRSTSTTSTADRVLEWHLTG